MPRTINPASARILADLLADRAPADRATDDRRRQAHPAGGASGCS
jgi:hypothetical protein